MTFSIRGVFRRTLGILRQGWLPITLVTVVTMVLPMLGFKYGRVFLSDQDMAGLLVGGWSRIFIPAIILAGWFLHAVHMGAVTEIALRIEAGKPIQPGQIVRNGAINAIPVFVIDLLLKVGMIAGAIALLVPGVLFVVVFSVVTPAYVCERKGLIGAFERSFRLTEGYRARIFATWLVIFVVANIITACIALPDLTWIGGLLHRVLPDSSFDIFAPPPPVSPTVGMLHEIVGIALFTLMIVVNAVMYLALRFDNKTPVDPRIEEVFE